jgi:hypothetical protein
MEEDTAQHRHAKISNHELLKSTRATNCKPYVGQKLLRHIRYSYMPRHIIKILNVPFEQKP